jgi:epoxyqueuosine reductase QueG
MNSDALWSKVSERASAAGVKIISAAPVTRLLATSREILAYVPGRFTTAVVIGIPIPSGSLTGITDSPTPLYFHHYRQVNYALDRAALDIALLLEEAGFESATIPASQIISYEPVLRGHISHKVLAQSAGLGWRGRNNLLVHPQFGSRLRFASILTEAQIGPQPSVMPFSCGSCRACIPVCPAGAIKERPEDFDLEACAAKLSQFARLPFLGQRICGICVKACSRPVSRGDF